MDKPKWKGWIVQVDVDVTRRKRFHYVDDQNGENRYIRRKFSEVLDDLLREDQYEALIFGPDEAYILTLRDASEYDPRTRNRADRPDSP